MPQDAPQPGYSSSDWAQLARKDPDLAGLQGQPPRRGITLEEVARHAGEEDAWMALRGRVYNVTPYLRFHPGGAGVLLEAAGRDATELFDRFHRWVDVGAPRSSCCCGEGRAGAAAVAVYTHAACTSRGLAARLLAPVALPTGLRLLFLTP